MKTWNVSSGALLIILWMVAIGAWAQQDPGPRPGPATAGGPYPTLNANEQAFFNQAFLRFQEVDTVTGTGGGLGPTFNGNSCVMCHTQPAIGGSGPGLASPQNPVPNPQVALATLDGATNFVPSFITAGRSGARGALRPKCGRLARWRRSWLVYDCRPLGCAGLYA